MSKDEMKRMARRIPAELSKGNVKVFDEVADPMGVDHLVPPGMPETLETTKKMIADMFTTFPDLSYKIEDEIAEGDLVVQRLTGTGTMKGAFMGLKPTGKRATWTELHVVRFRDGRIVEHWGNVDMATMMMQLGLVTMPQMQPAMGQPAARG